MKRTLKYSYICAQKKEYFIEQLKFETRNESLKVGGTSVGSAQRMKDVAKLITDGEQKIVVLSAMSGTTNTLVEISDYLYKKNPEGANEVINKLEAKYKQHIDELSLLKSTNRRLWSS